MNELEKNEENKLSPKIEIWDNSKRAKNLIIIFWILTGLTLIAIIFEYFELQLLKNFQIGIYVDESEANTSDLRQGIIEIVQIGVYIASIVLFLSWFRRAYGNLHRVGITYIKHKETVAVWTWFVPIVWFFRPVQIMNEIWTEIQEKIKKFDHTYVKKSGGLLIGLWWTLFIISNFIGRYVFKAELKQETVEQLIESSEIILISDILKVTEALLVILIVCQLSKMETKLAKEVKKKWRQNCV